MDQTYVTIAWAAVSFIAGAGTGLWLHHALTGGGGPRTPRLTRTGFAWARADVKIPPPTVDETLVRLETGPQGEIDGRQLTFYLEMKDGIGRDVSFSAHRILRFFKSGDDGPTRAGYHGANNDYTLLLAIAKRYQWTVPATSGKGWEWSFAFRSRERRLRMLEAWLTHG